MPNDNDPFSEFGGSKDVTKTSSNPFSEFGGTADPVKKKDNSVGFTHGYKPTSEDLKTKQGFTDLENGFNKLSNGSKTSQNTKSTIIPQNAEPKGSWSNIPTFGAREIFSGLEGDLSNLFGFAKDKLSKLPGLPGIGAGEATGAAQDFFQKAQKEDQRVAAANPLPKTTAGNVATSVTKFVPDIIELAATPELDVAKIGKLGEYAAKLGKVGTKAAEYAVGKFPIQQGTKKMLQSYSDAKEKGEDENQANLAALKGFGEGYKDGIVFEGAGDVAGKLTKVGTEALEKSGLMAGNKFIAGAEKRVLHSVAQGIAFSAAPVVQNAIEGKGTDLNEIKRNGIFGTILGGITGYHGDEGSTPADKAAAQVIMRKPLVDLHNFVNADIGDIKNIHNSEIKAPDLQAMSAAHAENGFKTDDPEEKSKSVIQSSLYGKSASIKTVTEAILKDKNGVIDEVNQLNLPDEAKKQILDKIYAVHKEIDPVEQQKTALANQITNLENEPKGDLIKDKERQVKVKDLNKQLDEIINKQYEQTKPNTEIPTEQPTDETTSAGETVDQTDETTKNNQITNSTDNESKNDGSEKGEKEESRPDAQKGDEKNDEDEKNGLKVTSGEAKTEPETTFKIGDDYKLSNETGKVIRVKELPNGDTELKVKKADDTSDTIIIPKGGKENATKENNRQESGGAEHQEGDESRETTETGNRNSPERSAESQGKEKPRYKIKGDKITKLPIAEHSELNNLLKEDGINISHLKDVNNQERDTGGDQNKEVATNAETVQQPENDGTGDAGKDRPSKGTENSEGAKSKATFKKPAKPSLTEAETARKLELRKKFLNRLNDVTNIPTLLGDKEFREYSGLVFKEALGDFKAFSKEMVDYVGDGIKEHLPVLYKELGGKLPEDEQGGKEVKKTILTKRAYEGEISDDVKKHLEGKGLTRSSFSQEERSKQATDLINKFGDDAAFQAVNTGDIDGGLAASTLAQLQIKNSEAMQKLPKDSDERKELAKKQATYIDLMEKKAYAGGEFNGQLSHEYQNADLNYANVKTIIEKATGKELTKEQEQNVKRITDENEKLKIKLQEAESRLIEETDKAFKAGEEAVKDETKAQKAKRVADKLRANAKVSRPGVFSSATPGSLVWDTAVEVVAKSIETGGILADAIDAGIKHIKETEWYKGLSKSKKAEAESEFKKFGHDKTGSTDLADLQVRFADKKDDKFSPSEAKAIWGYMKKTHLDNGVNYRDAIGKTMRDLGLTWWQVSKAITTPKTLRMSNEMWKRNADYARNRSAIKNWIGDQSKSFASKTLTNLSGVFRGVAVTGHSGIFVGTHAGMTLADPLTWHLTIPAVFRGWKLAYGKEAHYQRAMEELKNSPNYNLAQRAGLKNDPDRINAEEYQRSQQYLEKIGLGKLAQAGEKGFNAIKILRQGLFDYEFNKLSPEEKTDPEVAKEIAQLMNLATGATNIKNIPSIVKEVTFAGGMEAARWEKLIKSPLKAGNIALKAIFQSDKVTPAERVFAKVWARRVGTEMAAYTTALVANAAINNYLFPNNKKKLFVPTDPNWWKFKFGTVTVDPTSGMRSTAGFIKELVTTPFNSKAENYGKSGLKAEAENAEGYGRGKLAPLYSTIADLVDKKDFIGNTMPYNHDRPPKGHHHLSWTEYSTSKLPLPIAEAFGVFYNSALDHGAPKKTLDNVLRGFMSGAISGTTGFRVGEYKESKESKGMKKVTLLPK